MRANDRQVGGDHYRRQAIQHWDYVVSNGIPYLEAQIIKYVSRWRDKNGIEDLEKARHFLDKLIEGANEEGEERVSLGEEQVGDEGRYGPYIHDQGAVDRSGS